MSVPAGSVTPMSSLPLTRPAPWTEIPANMDPLFAELAPNGARPVEVAVTVPEAGGERCVMHLLVAEDDAPRAMAIALRACRGVKGFRIEAGPFEG
jgi:hypothetical protein